MFDISENICSPWNGKEGIELNTLGKNKKEKGNSGRTTDNIRNDLDIEVSQSLGKDQKFKQIVPAVAPYAGGGVVDYNQTLNPSFWTEDVLDFLGVNFGLFVGSLGQSSLYNTASSGATMLVDKFGGDTAEIVKNIALTATGSMENITTMLQRMPTKQQLIDLLTVGYDTMYTSKPGAEIRDSTGSSNAITRAPVSDFQNKFQDFQNKAQGIKNKLSNVMNFNGGTLMGHLFDGMELNGDSIGEVMKKDIFDGRKGTNEIDIESAKNRETTMVSANKSTLGEVTQTLRKNGSDKTIEEKDGKVFNASNVESKDTLGEVTENVRRGSEAKAIEEKDGEVFSVNSNESKDTLGEVTEKLRKDSQDVTVEIKNNTATDKVDYNSHTLNEVTETLRNGAEEKVIKTTPDNKEIKGVIIYDGNSEIDDSERGASINEAAIYDGNSEIDDSERGKIDYYVQDTNIKEVANSEEVEGKFFISIIDDEVKGKKRIETTRNRIANFPANKVGHIYVEPFYSGSGLEAFTIPFESNPIITSESIAATYKKEEIMTKMLQYRSYFATEGADITLDTTYMSESEIPTAIDELGNIDESKVKETWNPKYLNYIENAYRSLVLPFVDVSSNKFVKPPIIKIVLQNNSENNASMQFLKYPFTVNAEGKAHLFASTKAELGTSDINLEYKSFVVTNCTISNIEGLNYQYTKEGYRYGFKISLTMSETTRNFLDRPPSFKEYYDYYRGALV